MKFVDANVFVRVIARDEATMLAASQAFFSRLDRQEESATTSEGILGEVVYVLASPRLYGHSRIHIRDRLIALLVFRGWNLPDRGIWIRALRLYATREHLSFPDALAASHVAVRGLESIVSYDRDFDRIPGIKREEP